MNFKEIYNHDLVGLLSAAGLLIFFGVFVAVSVWAFVQRRGDVSHWSNLPLDDGTPPEHRRGPNRA
jgi:cbb3-type cytochrome oxidase subunit 3